MGVSMARNFLRPHLILASRKKLMKGDNLMGFKSATVIAKLTVAKCLNILLKEFNKSQDSYQKYAAKFVQYKSSWVIDKDAS